MATEKAQAPPETAAIPIPSRLAFKRYGGETVTAARS